MLDCLISKLFPGGCLAREPSPRIGDFQWEEHWNILSGETGETFRFLKEREVCNTAPGPDGFKATLWKKVTDKMVNRVTACFNSCMREGVFPVSWKRANLVLIPKAGKSFEKTFERIIAERLLDWMRENPEMDLSDSQFGFRKKSSTCDALLRVKKITTEAVEDGGIAIAIGLDIENAFNSLPWHTIRMVLADRDFPVYLRRIIDSYLSDRFIEFGTIEGKTASKRVKAGVPQGSVLDPLLWNIAYDSVMRTLEEPECHVICYADDTLVIATADCLQTATRASIQASLVMRQIQCLGLKVSEAKTEMLFFTVEFTWIPYHTSTLEIPEFSWVSP